LKNELDIVFNIYLHLQTYYFKLIEKFNQTPKGLILNETINSKFILKRIKFQMKKAGFEFRDHTADVQVRSWGSSLEEAFSQTAYSLMATITPNLKKISSKIEREITVEAEDKEALLFDFLSEFLYIFDVDELVFNQIYVHSIEKFNVNYKLRATLKGEKFNLDKHEIGTEVKAITYSFLNIEEKHESTTIDIVFDI